MGVAQWALLSPLSLLPPVECTICLSSFIRNSSPIPATASWPEVFSPDHEVSTRSHLQPLCTDFLSPLPYRDNPCLYPLNFSLNFFFLPGLIFELPIGGTLYPSLLMCVMDKNLVCFLRWEAGSLSEMLIPSASLGSSSSSYGFHRRSTFGADWWVMSVGNLQGPIHAQGQPTE